METDNQIIEPTFWQWRGFIRYTLAALLGFLLGLVYCRPYASFLGIFGLGPYDLTRMVQLEFLVIHSFPFLAIIGSINPTRPAGRRWQAVIFWGLIGVYIMASSQMYGWLGVLLFAGLTGTTYLGFFLHITQPRVVNQLVIRWGVNFVIYIFMAIVLDMPKAVESWSGADGVYTLGAVYFIASALVEWTGFYHARWINKLPISDVLTKGQGVLR